MSSRAFCRGGDAAAQADNSQGDFLFENYFNSSNDPHATTNGLIWIDTGNGVPFLTPNPVYSYDGDYPPPASDSTSWDLNIELLGGTSPSSLADLACDTSTRRRIGKLHHPAAAERPGWGYRVERYTRAQQRRVRPSSQSEPGRV